eukprot:39947-Eustigmatos_ZCMA.PRE.1
MASDYARDDPEMMHATCPARRRHSMVYSLSKCRCDLCSNDHDPGTGLVHATEGNGWTPLLFAAYYGHEEVAQYLLDYGVAVDHRDHVQRTALQWACFFGRNKDVVMLLLRRGADVTAVDLCLC